MKRKVYVGCGLANVPQESRKAFFDLIEDVRTKLATAGFEVLRFRTPPHDKGVRDHHITAKEVYEYDMECVKKCDLFLAICDVPGLGLGYELCYTVEVRQIPVLAVHRAEHTISKMIGGITAPNFHMATYENADDIVRALEAVR